jgi:hypothetical protein
LWLRTNWCEVKLVVKCDLPHFMLHILQRDQL